MTPAHVPPLVLEDTHGDGRPHRGAALDEEHFRRLDLVVQHTSNMVVVTNAQREIEWVNPAYTRITGWTLEEVRGRRPSTFLHGPKTDLPQESWIGQRLRRGEPVTRYEVLNYKKNGETYWCSLDIHPIRDAEGKIVRYVSIQADISARKALETQLQELNASLESRVAERTRELCLAQRFLHSLANKVPGMMAYYDPALRCRFANEALMRFHGQNAGELLGRHVSEIVEPAVLAEILPRMQAALGGQAQTLEVERRHADGTRFFASVSYLPDIEADQVKGVFVHLLDITPRRLIEERVRQANQALERRVRERTAELEQLAHYDPLTGLPNRLQLQRQLDDALRDAARDQTPLAVLLLDLDHFKEVNDSYGHLVGDQLLRHVADRLRPCMGAHDLLARLGGDEFVVLMQRPAAPGDAACLGQTLIDALARPWLSGEKDEIRVGVSIGICLFPQHGTTSEALLQGADAALYRAKADGRGVVRYFSDELTRAARERLQLEARLRRALAQGHLALHYQPQVDIASGQVIGAEALLRWHDPELGWIPPARFIPIAEASGLIRELGAWVLRETCRQGRAWLDQGLPPLRLAVNVSPRQFLGEHFPQEVAQALRETGFPPHQLEIELTEGVFMDAALDVAGVLRRLRGMGVSVAIDDFGMGYSSLAYLKRLPIDVLKIDRSFVADLPDDQDSAAISAAIIAMGHHLGLKVLAEGVETRAQLDFLRAQRCDRFQGYLTSRPVPPPDFAHLLREPLPAPQDLPDYVI